MTDAQIDAVIAKYFGSNFPGVMLNLYRLFARSILAAAIPPGWQVMPKEPTDEMVMAGYDYDTDVCAIYEAMLKAAPQPPQA